MVVVGHFLSAQQPRSIREVYTAEIGVREATGQNDGDRVEAYLRYCGLGPGYAYCAAFVSWAMGEAGYAEPRNPWSPALLPSARIVWRQRDHATSAYSLVEGDVFGIHYINLERIGHVGFVDEWDGAWCITVEGNTGPDNPIRAGPSEQGVHRKRRPVKTIHAIARWTK